MNRIIAFKIFSTLITLTLLVFQITIWKKLSPRIQGFRLFRIFRIIYFSMVFVCQSILWIAIVYPGRGIASAFPEWYIPIHKILLAINYSHAIWILPIALLWLVGMVLSRLRNGGVFASASSDLKTGRTPDDTGGEARPGSLPTEVSRSDFLRRAAGIAATGINLIPMATSAAAISGMFRGSREIWVNEKSITIRNLHDDLKGIRLVQISDIHIGNLIHEKYLNFALGLIRQTKPDYVLVTGDIIDNNNAFLPVAGSFFASLNAALPGRIFGAMGNHDYIHDGDVAADGFASAGMKMLMNDVAIVKRGRGNLQLAGLDYPGVPIGRGPLGKKTRHAVMQQFFLKTQQKLRADFPVLLLNHHPSDFDYLKTQGIDLVLSGHTHGGQIRFSSDRESALNGATWIYKYYVDHYHEQGSQLYVNRGLGHWFPLRVDCPPEITVFTLV